MLLGGHLKVLDAPDLNLSGPIINETLGLAFTLLVHGGDIKLGLGGWGEGRRGGGGEGGGGEERRGRGGGGGGEERRQELLYQ